jgi:hypothetical protein
MFKLKIQEILRNLVDKTEEVIINFLKNEYELESHFETGLNNVKYLHIDYSIFSSRTSEIVKECRGVVFEYPSFNIARFGFHRFLNYGEGGCEKLNLEWSINYDEKVDGSIIILSYMDGIGWVAGTRGRVFPDAKVNEYSITFPEMFWQTFPKDSEKLLLKSQFYIFELVGPENRVVVPYNRDVYLLGVVRQIKETEELREFEDIHLDNIAILLNVKRPKHYTFDILEECLDFAKTLPGNFEGFVAKQWDSVDNRYRRMKIKGQSYIDLHHVVSGKSLSNLVRIVIRRDRSYLSLFPEYLKAYDEIENILTNYRNELLEFFNKIKAEYEQDLLENEQKVARKNFAQKAMQKPYGKVCFSMLDGQFKDPWEYFEQGFEKKSVIKGLIAQFNLDQVVGSSWNVIDDFEVD